MNSTPAFESRLCHLMAQAREGVPTASAALRQALAGVEALPESLPGGWGRVHLAAAAALPALLRDALVTGALDAASRPCGAGMPPLGYALLAGSRETVEELLQFWMKLPDQVPFRGEPVSLLVLAVEGNCRGVAQRLAWRGVPFEPGLEDRARALGRTELGEELRAVSPPRLGAPLPGLAGEPGPVEAGAGEQTPGEEGTGPIAVEVPGRSLLAFESDAVAVGRQGDNDLVVSDDKVSRSHARLLRMNGGWYVEDRRSSNGTHLNGEEIQGVAPLKNGDVLQVGGVSLRLFLGREAKARLARGQLRLVEGGAGTVEAGLPPPVRGDVTVLFNPAAPAASPVPPAALEAALPTPLACAWRAAREATRARDAHAAVLRALHGCLALAVAGLGEERWVAALGARGFRPGLKDTVEALQRAQWEGARAPPGFSAWMRACEGLLAQLMLDRRRVAHGLSDPFPARALLGQVLAEATWLAGLELVYVVDARPHGRGRAGSWVQLRGVDPLSEPHQRVEVTWTAPLAPGTVYVHLTEAQRWTALPFVQVSGGAVAVMDGVDGRGRALFVDVRTGAPVPVAVPGAPGPAGAKPERPLRPRASGASWQRRDAPPMPTPRRRMRSSLREDEERSDVTPVKVDRFTCSPELVRDNRSGLTWQRAACTRPLTLAEARQYAERLTLAGGGWRLPTREELLGLVDLARRAPATDVQAFPGTPSTGFWAEDPSGGPAWVVSFTSGAAGAGLEADGWCVRCVRDDAAGR